MAIDPTSLAKTSSTGAARAVTQSSGGSRTAFAAALKDATAAAEEAKPTGVKNAPGGEKYAEVAGRAYDEIIDGPRNGMFVNQSGNDRHGKAFVRVERNDREYHVYGTGSKRQVIYVKPRNTAASTDSAASS